MLVSLDTPAADLKLTGRLPKVCKALRVKTVADFLSVSPDGILKLPGVGVGTADHLLRLQRFWAERVSPQTQTGGAPGDSPTGAISPALDLDTPLSELGLAGRLGSVCAVLRAQTVRDLLAINPSDIVKMPYVGQGTVAAFLHLQSVIREDMGCGGAEVAQASPSPADPHDDTPLDVLLSALPRHEAERARKAVATLGVKTVDALVVLDPARVRQLRKAVGTGVSLRLRKILAEWLAGRAGEHADKGSPKDDPTFGHRTATRPQPEAIVAPLGASTPMPDADAPIELLLRIAPHPPLRPSPGLSSRVRQLASQLEIKTVGELATLDFEHPWKWPRNAGPATITYIQGLLSEWIARGGRPPERDEVTPEGERSSVPSAQTVPDPGALIDLLLGGLPGREARKARRVAADLGITTVGGFAALGPIRARRLRTALGTDTVSHLSKLLAEWIDRGDAGKPTSKMPSEGDSVARPPATPQPMPDADAPVTLLLPKDRDNVSTRALHLFGRLGLKTVGEVASLDLDKVRAEVRNVGAGTVAYLRQRLAAWVARGGRPREPDEVAPEAESGTVPVAQTIPDPDAPIELLLPEGTDHVSSRANNAILKLGIKTVGDLASLDLGDKRKLPPGVGNSTVAYIKQRLAAWVARGRRDAELPELPPRAEASEGTRASSPLPAEVAEILSPRARGVVTYVMANLGISTLDELTSLDLECLKRDAPDVGADAIACLREAISVWIATSGQDAERDGERRTSEPCFEGGLREVLRRCAFRAAESKRNAEVWAMRRGLVSDAVAPLTLDEVGRHFKLTRERVRQIEHRTDIRVRGSETASLSPLVKHVEAELRACLGLCPTAHISAQLAGRFGWASVSTDHELVVLSDVMELNLEIRDGIVRHPDCCADLLKTVRARVPGLADQFPDGRHVADFVHDLAVAVGPDCADPDRDCTSRALSCGARDGQRRLLPRPYVEALLVEWTPSILDDGHVWPVRIATLRHGRTKRDVVRAALQTLGHAAHSSEIADCVRQNNDHFRRISDHNIHACLTSYDEFVPVGRGVYDILARNGDNGQPQKHVTTAQAITALLEEHGKPMSFSRILESLEPQGYGEANIYAALTAVSRFVEVGYRVYTLRSLLPEEKPDKPKRRLVIVDRLPSNGAPLALRRVGETT